MGHLSENKAILALSSLFSSLMHMVGTSQEACFTQKIQSPTSRVVFLTGCTYFQYIMILVSFDMGYITRLLHDAYLLLFYFLSILMKRAIALHHQQRARNANSSTATSTSKIPVSGGLVAHWRGAPTPVPAADWVLWSVIYAFFKQCLSFQKNIAQPRFAKSLAGNHGCSHVSYGCAFASFMQHFLVGQLSTLEPCHHRPLEVGVVPKSHHRGQTCTDAYCFGCYEKKMFIANCKHHHFPHKKTYFLRVIHKSWHSIWHISPVTYGVFTSPLKEPPGCSQWLRLGKAC